ncbi:MAG: T9SS type A sorting domain-containing protein [Bacteroidota bacterium]|nr:T9SS type A sorting domain-containing protein [Bacteroidota bacterium]
MKKFTNVLLRCIPIIFLITNVSYSWGSTGHKLINRKSVMHLPNSMATLKADSIYYESHASDADYRKNYNDTSFFAEAQRHYFDIDIYPNFHSLPRNLDSVIALYGRGNVRQNGTLPWAIQLTFDSLTAQFVRGDFVTAKATMSDLGHYVADAHQPLHCTENYDGKLTGNDGIHSRYESTMINTFKSSIIISQDSIQYIDSPLDYSFEYILHSNSLVDSVLAADTYAKSVSGWNGSGTPPSTYYNALWQKTKYFTSAQFQSATVALASLWYTAWLNAQDILTIDENISLFPSSITLEQNYPNPFNPKTEIKFQISHFSGVTLKVFDISGREIETLIYSAMYPGHYSVEWTPKDLGSGTYFYRLQVGGSSETRRMILVK